MSQQTSAEGDDRTEGQRRGSAVVLNDYMGLKLLGWGQTGSGCLSDSEAKKRVVCAPTHAGVDCRNYYVIGGCLCKIEMVVCACVPAPFALHLKEYSPVFLVSSMQPEGLKGGSLLVQLFHLPSMLR